MEIVHVDNEVLSAALGEGFTDYEDAVLHEAALKAGAFAIVTRNKKDFRKGLLPAFDADQIVRVLLFGKALAKLHA